MARKKSKVSKKSLENLIPAKKGEPSRNPLGVSKAKAEFRRMFEEVMKEEVSFKGKLTTAAEAAVRILLEAALEKKEKWAIEFICDKVAPKTLIVENEGNAPAGTPVINFEKVFEGLKIDAKTLDKMRERYLAQLFPDRGFSKEEES